MLTNLLRRKWKLLAKHTANTVTKFQKLQEKQNKCQINKLKRHTWRNLGGGEDQNKPKVGRKKNTTKNRNYWNWAKKIKRTRKSIKSTHQRLTKKKRIHQLTKSGEISIQVSQPLKRQGNIMNNFLVINLRRNGLIPQNHQLTKLIRDERDHLNRSIKILKLPKKKLSGPDGFTDEC